MAKGNPDYKTTAEEEPENKNYNNIIWYVGRYAGYTDVMGLSSISAEATATKTKYVNNGCYKFGGYKLIDAAAYRDKLRSETRER